MIKLVIAHRRDLNMRKGKMSAMTGHACVMMLLKRDVGNIMNTSSTRDIVIPLSDCPELTEWLDTGQTKIVVGIDNEEQLMKLYQDARNAGLPAVVVQDRGNTEFHGVPTYTTVAIGPAPEEQVDVFTRELELL